MPQPEKRPAKCGLNEKKDAGTPGQPKGVWPPAPVRPELDAARTDPVANYLLTGINWLDAVLGVPCGFIIGFILWGIAGFVVQEVVPPPSHRPQVLTIWAIGAVLTAIAYLLISRKYSLFAVTMWLGGLPFYSVMLLLAWCIP